ncbi:glycosyltransferase family 4 protein [Lacrimispora sp.]|uniref:glycosyltransferase family 4 protein n=1 Tax=Lacrimispora sp. TaxID=2719234 RepID=UPI0039958873
MNISRVLLDVTGYLKPVLLRIFPYEMLRHMKRKMIQDSYKKILKIERKPFQRGEYKDGINLIGNIKADTGLGQSCRLVADELEECQLPYSIYQYNQLGLMSNTNTRFDSKIINNLPYNINLIHINPHELGLAFLQMDRSFWDKRYNIGFWLWELEEFPDEWVPCFHLLDEVWTPSEFISKSIRKKTDLPVITIPYHVSVQVEKEYQRSDFVLPEDKFLFLMMYDRTSMTERKNPGAVLEAYKKAFSKENRTGLVIKINNCTAEEEKALRLELENYNNVYFITEVLNRDQVNSLIKCVDVVVSLHRAEGFGLVLAEAMSLGTPVIATNWSSNTEFMTKDTACLVDFELIELEQDMGLFRKGNHWAEPDVEQAAFYMKELYEKPEFYQKMAKQAKAHIEKRLNMAQAVEIINNRIDNIYRE